MVDLERENLHPALVVDDPVAIELDGIYRDSRKRQLLVGDANLDVERVGSLQVVHELARAGRSDHAVWCLARTEMRLQPAGEPQVGDS